MPTTRTWLQAGGGTVAAALIIAAVVQAMNSSAMWVSNDPVGECGQTSGGAVVAAQNVLWAGTGLEPVDGAWDTESEVAAKAFQAYNGLPVNGCVDTSTWLTMRAYLISLCDPEFDCRGPDHRVRYTAPDGAREAFFADNECDWGSYVLPGVAASPVTSNKITALSRDAVVEIECEG
ncbi:peptidoglycan-binding domain-containing protein [Promicromonospora sp. CA-289599]|uniref:peptidoglycan-binding domain-containing protein n=1 Tax=Promicromonospora sp. CA-289599 TaxID=3240014 RepID=UPI003D931582